MGSMLFMGSILSMLSMLSMVIMNLPDPLGNPFGGTTPPSNQRFR